MKKYTVIKFLWGEIEGLQDVVKLVIGKLEEMTTKKITNKERVTVYGLLREILPETKNLKEEIVRHGVEEEITRNDFDQMNYEEFYDLYDSVVEKNQDFFIKDVLTGSNLLASVTSGQQLETSTSLLKSILDSAGEKSKEN